jgi:hypothetical protein
MPKQTKAPRVIKVHRIRDPTIALFTLLTAIKDQNVDAYWTALEDLNMASQTTGRLPQMATNDVTTPAEINALITLCEHELGFKPDDRTEGWPHILTAKTKLIAALKAIG